MPRKGERRVGSTSEDRRYEIFDTVTKCGGHISNAAELLGLHRATVAKWYGVVKAEREAKRAEEAARPVGRRIDYEAATSWTPPAPEWKPIQVPPREMFAPRQPQIELPPPVQRLVPVPRPYRKIAFLSDIHFPYHDQPAVDVALAALRDWRPELVVLGGDIFDFYQISEYSQDPSRRLTIQDELDSARGFWESINNLDADVIYLEGNHESRLTRTIHKNPGLYNLRALSFPIAAELPRHWRWYPSQTHLKVGPLILLHGDLRGGPSGVHIAWALLKRLRTSCLFGHFHRFDIAYETGYDGLPRVGFGNGHLSDVLRAEYVTTPNWQTGFSTIEYSPEEGIFAVQQHLIINGQLVFRGRIYGQKRSPYSYLPGTL